MFYGLLNAPWWVNVVYMAFATQLTILGVTLYLHRSQAHRSVDLHPFISHIFRFWIWMTTGMETKVWTAIHRKHHAKCETKDDPHSPVIMGFKTVMWQGAELYRKEAKNQETLDRYGRGTPEDWVERKIYKHSGLGLKILFVVLVSLFGVPGLGMWAIQLAWMPFFAAGLINGLGHHWGYRNFECSDAATNLTPWGLIVGGEELHNNHHTYPTSAKFSVKPWEFDIGWMFLTIFKFFGLAKIKRVAPKVEPVPGKSIDIETVRHLINNRFQVMTRYSKSVIVPVLKQEKKRLAPQEWNLIKSVKAALTREPSRVDMTVKQKLVEILPSNPMLHQTYEFKERLQMIWDQTAATPKELVDALQQWCKEAEATGHKALKEFAAYIQSYRLNAGYL